MSGIKARIEGDKKMLKFLRSINGGIKTALNSMGEYFIGNEAHGLKHYPPPRPTKTGYVRTGTLRSGWAYTAPQGNKLYIQNPVSYAGYVQGNPPAEHMRRRGWRGWKDVIASNMAGALRAGKAALLSWARSRQ